jgi:hypothetical protein
VQRWKPAVQEAVRAAAVHGHNRRQQHGSHDGNDDDGFESHEGEVIQRPLNGG